MLNYLKEEIEQAKEMEKEQQEKMYSEEDMRKAFKSSSLTNMLDVYESFEEFIEQFKNK
jgi:predicted ATP-binding protein involved in virulence